MTDQPCEWPIMWPDGSTIDAADQETVGPVAAYIVWALSGRQFGRCRCWVRPVTTPLSGAWCEPTVVDGRWLNTSGNATLVQLPRPTVEVHEVRIADATLHSSAYKRIGDSLVRLDGDTWPVTQRLDARPGETGWWAVDLTTGYPVPVGGRLAAGILAAEMIKARRGGKCRLPARAQSVAREGIDVLLVDPSALYTAGLTGLPEVDQWITAVNPARMTARASVSSPDHPLRGLRGHRR